MATYLLAEDLRTNLGVVHIVEDFGKAYRIERYDSVSEEWVTEMVNALRVKTVNDEVPAR